MTCLSCARRSLREQRGIVHDRLTCKHLPALRITLTIAVMFAIVVKLPCQQTKPGEYQVKAAYLYNFGRFIEWPAKGAADSSNSFVICVLGQDPFGLALNATLADETIGGKSVIARRIPDAADAVNCHVLFISSSEAGRLRQILTVLKDASVLTVSDLPQFSRIGGMVQFTMEGGRVRFEVNLAPAERAGLILSSELLRVAANVRRGGAVGD